MIYFLASLAAVILFVCAVLDFLWKRYRGVTRKWLQSELSSYLKNDTTPIAVYQRQTRDEVQRIGKQVGDMHADVREMRSMVIGHVTDKSAHR